MGGSGFDTSPRRQTMKQLRRVPPTSKRNSKNRRRSSTLSALSRKNNIAVVFSAIVTFSILSLCVQLRDHYGIQTTTAEGNFLTIPNPPERRDAHAKKTRQLKDPGEGDNKNPKTENESTVEHKDDNTGDGTHISVKEILTDRKLPKDKNKHIKDDAITAPTSDDTLAVMDINVDKNNRNDKNDRKNKRYGNNDIKNKTKRIPKDWFDFNLPQQRYFKEATSTEYINLVNFSMGEPIDTLSNKFDVSSLHSTNLTNELPHLGVLLDAGRHYFPVEWIKRMIDVLSIMNYNLIHFRLTDDQTFNVQLESQPLLAYPTTLNNNTKVYSPNELRDIVKYAKSKGIQVVPEINVPGHAASWGGMPELIVQCPQFICRKGYGVPLNVSSPKLRPVLKDILEEIVDIFDKPPYLHLGGDEVDMAQPCFDEIGETMFDYNDFEKMLRSVLLEVGYNDSQVMRWEMTHIPKGLTRAGDITHFWFGHLGDQGWLRKYGKDFSDPVFLSTGLYFDTNEEESAWDVYVKTKRLKHNQHQKSPILGVIGGTFELSTQYWHDRNVIGKLLAVSMGVSNINTFDRLEFFSRYREICKSTGFDDSVCNLYGLAPRRYQEFRYELKDGGRKDCVWTNWIANVCNRLTNIEHGREYQRSSTYGGSRHQRIKNADEIAQDAKEWFWLSYFKDTEWEVVNTDTTNKTLDDKLNRRVHKAFRVKRFVQHTGIIMDIAQFPVKKIERLEEIVHKTMSRLGLNTIQLRLINDFSFAYYSSRHTQMFYMPPIGIPDSKSNVYPSMQDLLVFRGYAATLGVAIMPEVSISTNAGGLHRSAYNVKCANFLCEHGRYIPQDINNVNYVPVAYSIVQELLKFSSSKYLHLGYDEREMSTPCFLEASKTPDFDHFEAKLKQLLELVGVRSDRVVRWENKEKVHYPGRIGDITQCSAGESCESTAISKGSNGEDVTSSPWFATVDVRLGGPWNIYETTYDLASRSPIGLMAEVGGLRRDNFSENFLDYRLLAFNIGTLDLPKMDRDKFEEAFVDTCSSLASKEDLDDDGKMSATFILACKGFASTNDDAPSIVQINEEKKLKDFAQAICKERTMRTVFRVMKNASSIPTAISMHAGIMDQEHEEISRGRKH